VDAVRLPGGAGRLWGDAAGHMAVFCNAAPGCRSVWYRPRCSALAVTRPRGAAYATTSQNPAAAAWASRDHGRMIKNVRFKDPDGVSTLRIWPVTPS
jgi:hypothetical protein